MPLRITIIGGLEENPDRATLLDRLRARTGDDVEWEWLKAEPPQWNVPAKLLSRLAGQFRHKRPDVELPKVVKLNHLHGRDQGALYSAVPDPALAPPDVQCTEELVEWLLSAEAKLIPPTEWYGRLSEAALAALLSKLIKKKSWNKDTQGHAWTQEAWLLADAPVDRPGFEAVRAEAETLLNMADGALFLSKGGNQGKTPKEWCIKVDHLPLVKRMMLARSFDHLGGVAALEAIHRRVSREGASDYRIDGEIVTERVLYLCRS